MWKRSLPRAEWPLEQLSVKDLHQTIQLVCPDFPFKVVSDIYGIARTNFRLKSNHVTPEGNPSTVVQGGMIGTGLAKNLEVYQSKTLSQDFFNVFTTYLFFLEYFTVTQKIFPQILQFSNNNVPNTTDIRVSFFKLLENAIDDFDKKDESIEIPPLRSARSAAQDSFHYYAETCQPSSLDRVFVKMRIASHGSETANDKASTGITSNELKTDKDGKAQNNGGTEQHTNIVRIVHDRFVIALAEDPIVRNLIQETATCSRSDAFEAQKGDNRYWT